MHRRLFIKSTGLAFATLPVFFSGDQVDNGGGKYGPGDLQQVSILRAPAKYLYGNHDGPQDRFATTVGPLNWTHDIGPVRLVGLNSGGNRSG